MAFFKVFLEQITDHFPLIKFGSKILKFTKSARLTRPSFVPPPRYLLGGGSGENTIVFTGCNEYIIKGITPPIGIIIHRIQVLEKSFLHR